MDLGPEVLHVPGEERVADGVVEGAPEEAQRLADDEPVGHPVEAEPREAAVRRLAVVADRPLEGAAARAARRDERPVDVEEVDRPGEPGHAKSASTNSFGAKGFRSATVSPMPT